MLSEMLCRRGKSAPGNACLRVLLALGTCLVVLADTGARVEGTVTDPSGAPMPGVVVTVSNASTGAVSQSLSGSDGLYTFTDLSAGPYELKVEHPGFKPFTRTGIDVPAGAIVRAYIELALETRGETMLVTESPTQIDTVNTQSGERIGAAKMEGIPINGRSFTDLLALQPGVIPASSQQPNAVVMAGCSSTPPSGDLNPGNLSVSGQRETANGFFVNGGSAQEDFNMGTAIVPNLDSIQEFRVLTNNFDAEYGNFSGGQVLLTTKSGTNQVHGSLFEFVRNTNLDARNFFSAERAEFDRNQFGATAGGPIRKDKTYFFVDYQGTRMTQGLETGLISVPSVQNRAGDLSDVANTLTGKVNGQYWADFLTRRLGYTVKPGEPYYTAGCTTSAQCVLPNARIPTRSWSMPAQSLMPYIPVPNQGNRTFSTSAENQALRDDKGAISARPEYPLGHGRGLLLCRRLHATTIPIRPAKAERTCRASTPTLSGARRWSTPG